MSNNENILDLNASEIDELIQTLKEIEDLALSTEGLGQINMVIELFETNLDGLYKKAMVEQVKVRKGTFIEVIEELRDRRIRLERYREFLQTGAQVKVVQNQNYINVNPKDDIKNASDLELAIRTLTPRIEDDYDVVREADNEIDELEGIIASKLRQEPPADVSHERELISILNTNKGLFNALDSSVPKALTNTSKMPEDFDKVNKLFKTDLDNFHIALDESINYKVEEMSISSLVDKFGEKFFPRVDYSMTPPHYGKGVENLNELPQELQDILKAYSEKFDTDMSEILEHLYKTEDGFITSDLGLMDILHKDSSMFESKNMFNLYNSWHLYGIVDGDDITFSLYKLRTSGIACSFVELTNEDLTKLENSPNVDEIDKLLTSIYGVTDRYASSELASYFSNPNSQGSYVICDMLMYKALNGNLVGLIDENEKQITIEEYGFSESYDELPNELQDIIDSMGVYENGKITLENHELETLSPKEYNTLIALITADDSPYGFAAENKYHADRSELDKAADELAQNYSEHPGLYGSSGNSILMNQAIQDRIADSAKTTNAGPDDKNFIKNVTDNYYHGDGAQGTLDQQDIHNPNK